MIVVLSLMRRGPRFEEGNILWGFPRVVQVGVLGVGGKVHWPAGPKGARP